MISMTHRVAQNKNMHCVTPGPEPGFSEGGLHECGHVCMHKHARLGGIGGMLTQEICKNFLKLDVLRPFWDKNRAVVAVWLAEYCIQFLAVLICICQAR